MLNKIQQIKIIYSFFVPPVKSQKVKLQGFDSTVMINDLVNIGVCRMESFKQSALNTIAL